MASTLHGLSFLMMYEYKLNLLYIAVGMDSDPTKPMKFVGLRPVSAENRIPKTYRNWLRGEYEEVFV